MAAAGQEIDLNGGKRPHQDARTGGAAKAKAIVANLQKARTTRAQDAETGSDADTKFLNAPDPARIAVQIDDLDRLTGADHFERYQNVGWHGYLASSEVRLVIEIQSQLSLPAREVLSRERNQFVERES